MCTYHMHTPSTQTRLYNHQKSHVFTFLSKAQNKVLSLTEFPPLVFQTYNPAKPNVRCLPLEQTSMVNKHGEPQPQLQWLSLQLQYTWKNRLNLNLAFPHTTTKCGCNSLAPVHYNQWIHSKSNEIIWHIRTHFIIVSTPHIQVYGTKELTQTISLQHWVGISSKHTIGD
jgi:hypothetical protein